MGEYSEPAENTEKSKWFFPKDPANDQEHYSTPVYLWTEIKCEKRNSGKESEFIDP